MNSKEKGYHCQSQQCQLKAHGNHGDYDGNQADNFAGYPENTGIKEVAHLAYIVLHA